MKSVGRLSWPAQHSSTATLQQLHTPAECSDTQVRYSETSLLNCSTRARVIARFWSIAEARCHSHRSDSVQTQYSVCSLTLIALHNKPTTAWQRLPGRRRLCSRSSYLVTQASARYVQHVTIVLSLWFDCTVSDHWSWPLYAWHRRRSCSSMYTRSSAPATKLPSAQTSCRRM